MNEKTRKILDDARQHYAKNRLYYFCENCNNRLIAKSVKKNNQEFCAFCGTPLNQEKINAIILHNEKNLAIYKKNRRYAFSFNNKNND